MFKSKWTDADGYIKRAPKQGSAKKDSRGTYSEYGRKTAQICLNCTKTSCNRGNCKLIRKGDV